MALTQQDGGAGGPEHLHLHPAILHVRIILMPAVCAGLATPHREPHSISNLWAEALQSL